MIKNLPEKALGVTLDDKNNMGYGELPLPKLKPDDVLVEIFGGPINPSDVYFLEGTYPVKRNRPTITGFEGSGRVIGTGGSGKFEWLVGKNICFFGGDERSFGSYGNYSVMPGHTVFPLPEGVDLKTGSACLVNPLTVEIFIDLCEKREWKAMVHTGAAGALGKILISACKKKNLVLINIVRTDNQVQQLKSLGSEHVLNCTSPTFKKDFLALSFKLKPKVFFDAVSGKTGSEIISLMPNDSFVYSYGNLSRDNLSFDPSILLFKNITIGGIWLSKYAGRKDIGALAMTAFQNLSDGTYATTFAKEFPPSQMKEALDYYAKNASQGKVLIRNPMFGTYKL